MIKKECKVTKSVREGEKKCTKLSFKVLLFSINHAFLFLFFSFSFSKFSSEKEKMKSEKTLPQNTEVLIPDI